MLLVFLIDLVVIAVLVRAARRSLEDALPALAFFLVLIPYESKLVIPGVFDLSTARVGVLAVLFLFLTRKERANHGPIPLKSLMYLRGACLLASAMYSLQVGLSAKQVLSQVLEYFVLYYILVSVITKVETIYRIIYAMILALGICCIFGVIEAYALWSILSIFPSELWTTYGRSDPLCIEWGRGLRLRSTFPHPILFGDALAMCIPLALFMLSVWKKKSQRIILWFIVLLMTWSIYKTSSRGPWLALIMSFVLLFLFVNNRVRKYLITLAVLSVLVAVSRPGIWDTIANLYESTQDSSSIAGASYQYRNALQDAITAAVAEEPGRTLLGYGPGTFRELGLDINFRTGTRRWYTCDNNWALFLYEIGYLGLFVTAILLLKPLWMTLQCYRKLPRPERNLSGVLFIVLAGFYFLLASVAGYSWGQQSFIAWILIALSVSYPRIVAANQLGEDGTTTLASGPGEESEFALAQQQPNWGQEIAWPPKPERNPKGPPSPWDEWLQGSPQAGGFQPGGVIKT